MKDWLEDLFNEYPTDQRSDMAIARLARVFSEQSDGTMRSAVDRYLLNEKWFPRVADLRPYVAQAAEDARGSIPLADEGAVIRYGRIISAESQPCSDDDLYLFEVERGSMPALDELHDYWEVVIDATGLRVEVAELK